MADSRLYSSRVVQMFAETMDEGLVPRILITSQRHQQGKSATMMRLMEKVEEEVNGRKFSVDNFCLTPLEFVQRRKIVPERTLIGLDEPSRKISNKSWYTQESQAFVEDLVEFAFEHKPALMALPHSSYLNSDVFGVATSLIVKQDLSHARLYTIFRKMIDRRMKVRTRKIGDFEVGKPYEWDWQAWLRKRAEFNIKREKDLEAKIRAVETMSETSDMSKEQVFLEVQSDPDRFKLSGSSEVSASKIESELGVSYAKANYASIKMRGHSKQEPVKTSDS